MISIIIPVYNASQDLPRCIESVLSQDFDLFELILINDGSGDNSLEICNRYSQQDDRIKVINKNNEGVSTARNNGLKISKGDFVCFIDADDWVDNNYLSSLRNNIIKYEADLVISNVKRHYPNRIVKNQAFQNLLLESKSFSPDDFFINNDFVLGNHIFGKLFKKTIIEQNKIGFDRNLKNGEDLIFGLEYGLDCKKIIFTNDYTYNYNQQSDSSVTQKYFKDYYHHLKNTKDAYFKIVEKYTPVSEEEKLYQYFRVAAKAIFEEGKISADRPFKNRYHSIKSILEKSEIQNFTKHYKLPKENDSKFFLFIRKLAFRNQSLLLTSFLTLYFKLNSSKS